MKQCESCRSRRAELLMEFGDDGAEYELCRDCAFGVKGVEVRIREAIFLVCGFEPRPVVGW